MADPNKDSITRLIEARRRLRLKAEAAQRTADLQGYPDNPMYGGTDLPPGDWELLEPGVYMDISTGKMIATEGQKRGTELNVPPGADANIINTMAAAAKKGATQPPVIDETSPNRDLVTRKMKRKANLSKIKPVR